MGQKVNPHGLRVGVIKDWDSKWYAEGDFADYLVEDYNIQNIFKEKNYTQLVFQRLRSRELQTALRLSFIQLSQVL